CTHHPGCVPCCTPRERACASAGMLERAVATTVVDAGRHCFSLRAHVRRWRERLRRVRRPLRDRAQMCFPLRRQVAEVVVAYVCTGRQYGREVQQAVQREERRALLEVCSERDAVESSAVLE